jgi:hypothetical protein
MAQKSILPSDPSRADVRLICLILSTFHAEKRPAPTTEEIQRLIRAFARMGGSWEDLFKGSADDLSGLKKLVKRAVERGLVSSSPLV